MKGSRIDIITLKCRTVNIIMIVVKNYLYYKFSRDASCNEEFPIELSFSMEILSCYKVCVSYGYGDLHGKDHYVNLV